MIRYMIWICKDPDQCLIQQVSLVHALGFSSISQSDDGLI